MYLVLNGIHQKSKKVWKSDDNIFFLLTYFFLRAAQLLVVALVEICPPDVLHRYAMSCGGGGGFRGGGGDVHKHGVFSINAYYTNHMHLVLNSIHQKSLQGRQM